MDSDARHHARSRQPDCQLDWQAVRAALGLISGRWDLPVLAELTKGSQGHRELQRATMLDSQQLTLALQHLEESRLIERKAHTTASPTSTHYCLTSYGHSLVVILEGLARWRRSPSPSI